MPAYVKLILSGPAPHADQMVDFRHVNGLRAMVYDSLACVDPVFAQEMHADTWPKPLTLSPLWWRDGCWELEISVLLDQVGNLLLQGLAVHDPVLRLGRDEYLLQGVRMGAAASVEEMLQQAAPVSQIMVDFLTPTTHHDTLMLDPVLNRKTKISNPFPDPARTVTSWFHKWNCLMGRMGLAPIPEEFLEILPHLALSRMQGETQIIHLNGKQSLVGFVGSAVFEVIHAETLPPYMTTTLSLLAAFANFSGTGVETLRGMGQTRTTGRR